jgi:hypothetical protein
MSVVKEKGSRTFTVPSTSGSYAFERFTVGDVKAGMVQDSFQGITVNVDTSVASMTCELWLPRIDATPGSLIDSDYTYTGKSIGATGSETWSLAGYPGAQIRVKSGGTSGSARLSVSAF